MSTEISGPDFSRGNEGLLPVIAQCATTGEVLMLAWMNQTTWNETITTKRVVYWSRSRNQPWRKGDTSGHVQELVEARVDCDRDAILLRVHQVGAACHDGYASCFYRRVEDNGQLTTITERLVDPTQVYGK